MRPRFHRITFRGFCTERAWRVLLPIALFPGPALADDSFLREKVHLRLPTDGTELRTPPLEPYTVYHVRIFSPASLFPVYRKIGFFSTQEVSEILLDDRRLFAVRHDAGAVEFLYRGLGRPLSLRLASDYHVEIPFADVEVWPESWRDRLRGDPVLVAILVLVAGLAMAGIVGVEDLWWRVRQRERERQAKRPWIPPPSPPVGEGWRKLRPTGREIFTPGALHVGRIYEVTVAGTYYYQVGVHIRSADACYATDGYGNFTEPHVGLLLDGKPLADWAHEIQEADRVEHRYRFRIDGTGQRLSVALRLPPGAWLPGQHLAVSIRPLPETTRSAAAAWRDAGVERAAREQEARQQRWSARASELEAETQNRRNWEDAAFRQEYVRRYGPELLQRKAEIVKKHAELVRGETPEFLAYLKEQHVGVFWRLTGEFEACLEAERVDVARVAKPARKLTPEQYRERLVRQIKIQMGDGEAVMETISERRGRLKEKLEARGLAPEEIEQQLAIFDAQMAPQIDRLVEGKEGHHARPPAEVLR